ncbi:LacI family DNA-binding transcriptional regulator [Nocardioides sp. GY 10127]|uniref:LacI family DNA-binding transcriptional regulator n=1 Tax=Nocardioides sp. GY 10127 TaxID=2569762 RepID=UPI0010A8230B|nr:LacI family DNA-binding transcriptional regulator [Nocardioides sp. GY 10127]TIC80063.1 LacI family transcriptional regulator [Nocardioides sp. GY 10127]
MEKPAARVGIRDVARAAGLSITTVSWALNDKGEVAESTRARVKALAAELGYRPNQAARTLKSGRSHVLAVAIGHRESAPWQETYMPYYRSVLAGAAIEAVEHGHAVAAVPVSAEGRLSDAVAFDGLIVVDPVRDDPILAECRARGIPVVADGRPLDEGYDEVAIVDSDVREPLLRALDHMRGAGAARPALLTGSEHDAYTLDTERWYAEWCAEHGLPEIVERVAPDATPAAAASALLARGADAVHALNETYGNAVLARAAALSLRLPDDLQVTMAGERTSAADYNGAGYLVLDGVGTGAAAVRVLVRMLEGEPPASLRLPCDLILPHPPAGG